MRVYILAVFFEVFQLALDNKTSIYHKQIARQDFKREAFKKDQTKKTTRG